MDIAITKRGHRAQLRCLRADGTQERADLGPQVPHHDLAHFVAERRWALRGGFFGNIARGCSVAQLSDPEFIVTRGPQALQAEVLARGLQSVASGACAPSDFAALVNTELAHWRTPLIEAPVAMVEEASGELAQLAGRYQALGDGESLMLQFALEDL